MNYNLNHVNSGKKCSEIIFSRFFPIIFSDHYANALNKLKKLESKSYAYTTDCEEHAEQKALKTFNAIKKKNIKENEELGKKLLSQVPRLNDKHIELDESDS